MPNQRHRLLLRQAKRHLGEPETNAPTWTAMLDAVSTAYEEFDSDRAMLERSLELSSRELLHANADLRALFDALPDLFLRIDHDDTIVDCKVGSNMREHFPNADVLGTSVYDLPLVHLGQHFFQKMRSVRTTRAMEALEYSIPVGAVTRYFEARLIPLLENQIILIIRDISAKVQAEKELLMHQDRLQRQNQFLLDIAKSTELMQGDLSTALNYVARTAADALVVESVGIWLYDDTHTRLVCRHLFSHEDGFKPSGQELRKSDYPIYFAALDENRSIAAHDAVRDPSMVELVEGYLIPGDITSLLDAPIRSGGRTVGVICNEHSGGPRTWSLEDQNLAASIADVVSLVLETHRLRSTQRAFDESEARFKTLAETTHSAIFAFRERLLYANPSMESLSGYSSAELSAMRLVDLVHPDFHEQVARIESGDWPAQDGPRLELKILTRMGEERWLYLTAARADFDGETAFLASAFDITERKHAEEELRHQAFHDKLTGLPNRALLLNRLEHAFALSKRRAKYQLAILFIDLDRFKTLNDSLGHLVGDQLLREIGLRLKNTLRPSDTIARFGGDEFCVLLEDIENVTDAVLVADRILRELSAPLTLAGQEVFTSASIGIVLNDARHARADELLRDADIAMYRAKSAGKGRYAIFDEAMHQHATTLLSLETDLRRAIDRAEFELHYQPIVTLGRGALAGFEALIRWRHPERGLVLPMEFIPLAEETGMIIDIGNWVFYEACRQLKKWQGLRSTECNLKMSVNFSARQISRPDALAFIQQVLADTGVDPKCLCIEITESLLMENPESVITTLHQLHSLGISIYLDDFGTGYSSLSYLHKFPIDTLKIDRSFIRNLGHQGHQDEIVRSILMLAESLKIGIIAEGVETEEQADQLRIMGGRYAQGYLFSRPLGVSQATELVAQNIAHSIPHTDTPAAGAGSNVAQQFMRTQQRIA